MMGCFSNSFHLSASLFGLFDSLVPLIIRARKDWKAELVEID